MFELVSREGSDNDPLNLRESFQMYWKVLSLPSPILYLMNYPSFPYHIYVPFLPYHHSLHFLLSLISPYHHFLSYHLYLSFLHLQIYLLYLFYPLFVHLIHYLLYLPCLPKDGSLS